MKSMIEFIKKYSYDCIVMYVDQIAVAIFGLALAFACGRAENTTLLYVCSIGAVLFLLFIQGLKLKSMGAKGRISCDAGHKKKDLFLGLKLALLTNSFNLLLAVLITFGKLIRADGFTSIVRLIALFSEGMYIGLLSIKINGQPLNDLWLSFFLIVIPSLVGGCLSYLYGYADLQRYKKEAGRSGDSGNGGHPDA